MCDIALQPPVLKNSGYICLFATNHFKKNTYIDILRMLAPYQLGYMVIVVVLQIIVVFIMRHIQVLVGSVAMIFNVVMTIALGRPVYRKAYSDLN